MRSWGRSAALILGPFALSWSIGCGGNVASSSRDAGGREASTESPDPEAGVGPYPPGAIATLGNDRDVVIFEPGAKARRWRIPSDVLYEHPDDFCWSLAFDGARRLYVLCRPMKLGGTPGRILVFASGATGAATPLNVVAPASVGDDSLRQIAVAPSFDLVTTSLLAKDVDGGVACSGGVVRVFGGRAALRQVPDRVLRLDFCPVGAGADSHGTIYVAVNPTPILLFAREAAGAASPWRTIMNQGDTVAMTVDPYGDVYVADARNRAILYYPIGATDPMPTRTIAGASTNLDFPSALAVDAAGRVYVVDSGRSRILIFPRDADGDVAPEVIARDDIYGQAVAVAP